MRLGGDEDDAGSEPETGPPRPLPPSLPPSAADVHDVDALPPAPASAAEPPAREIMNKFMALRILHSWSPSLPPPSPPIPCPECPPEQCTSRVCHLGSIVLVLGLDVNQLIKNVQVYVLVRICV